jgi:DNA primase
MARIPQEEIDRIQQEVAVERLVEASGVELKQVGKDRWGLCPFHADKNPSLVVTPSKNLWRCPPCGQGGGPLEWTMKKNGVSFRHAFELLREGIPALVAGAAAVKRSTVRALDAPVSMDADDQTLLNNVIDYYHQCLKQSPEALAYLESRGMTGAAAAEAIDTFKLGFANRTLGLRLPAKGGKEGEAIRTRLTKVGLYRASGHEHFNGSLIVPVLNEHDDVQEVYGRKITDGLRKGTPSHLYLPGPHRGVFNVHALAAHQEIILCEALIDALTFWCAGYRNVTASFGVDGFTDDLLAAMKRYATSRVLIAFDRDDAGERGAAKVAERLMAEGIECFRIQFPKGMDANDYALKVQPASKSLGLVIRKSGWLGKGPTPAAPGGEPMVTAPPPAIAPAPPPENPPPFLAAKEEAGHGLPASPVPPAAQTDLPVEVKDNEILLTLGDRRYRVRGLAKNLSFELLKINLLASRNEAFYVDTLDLYSAKQRQSYIAHAAIELQIKDDILKADLGRVLMKLEQLQEAAIAKALRPAEPAAVSMPDAERDAALELLRAPNLMERLLADFAACGLVGEETNKLVGYLAAVSRKLEKPLGLVIQSSSAAGKTSLMDAVLAFVPEEDRVKYSAMTGQSLFYMGETNLKHKALAIVEEEGAARASYALKLLQSEGELTIASTGKDPQSGNLITQQYRVEGPVALLVTTTARDIDEELLNRCLVLAVDESRDQTRAIHQLQRDKRTLEGLIAKREKEALIQLHQNAQRLMRPLDVLNPYARFLTFPDQTTRLRRDHEKYLTLIDTIAFVHQRQRDVKTAKRGEEIIEYIEVTLDDIALANRIAHDVLGRSLDELPPQTRRLLKLVDQFVAAECARMSILRVDFRFSRKAVRDATGLSDTQLRLHLQRLVELEYLLVHRGQRGQSFEYELLYDGGGDERAALPGLIDVDALQTVVVANSATTCEATTASSRGQDPRFAGSSRAQRGVNAAGSRTDESAGESVSMRFPGELPEADSKTPIIKPNGKATSYPHAVSLVATS